MDYSRGGAIAKSDSLCFLIFGDRIYGGLFYKKGVINEKRAVAFRHNRTKKRQKHCCNTVFLPLFYANLKEFRSKTYGFPRFLLFFILFSFPRSVYTRTPLTRQPKNFALNSFALRFCFFASLPHAWDYIISSGWKISSNFSAVRYPSSKQASFKEVPLSCARWTTFAAFSYPMCGESAVASISEE